MVNKLDYLIPYTEEIIVGYWSWPNNHIKVVGLRIGNH
jgi:hypothetical protein